MLVLSFSFLVLLNFVTAIIPSPSYIQAGQHQQQNTSRLDPPSSRNGSETNLTSLTTISTSSTSVTLAGPSLTGSENATGTTPTISRDSNHTFITTFVSSSTSNVSAILTTSTSISTSPGSTDMPLSTAHTTALFPSRMNNKNITVSQTQAPDHTELMPSPPSITSTTSTSEHSESHTTSLHAICKKSGPCSPAPTSASRKNKNLQVTVESNSHSGGTGTKTSESTRTSGTTSRQSHNDRPTDVPSAPNLPFGNASSTIPPDITASSIQNGTLSTEIPTPGTSAVASTTTTPIPGAFGVNDPRFPIPSSPPAPPQLQHSPSEPSHNKHIPLIIGLVVGLTLFLCIVSAVGIYLFKKRRRSRFRYDDKLPLDFARIGHTPTTKVAFGREDLQGAPQDQLVAVSLPSLAYAPPVNTVKINKPLPVAESGHPPAQSNLRVINEDSDENQFYGVALLSYASDYIGASLNGHA